MLQVDYLLVCSQPTPQDKQVLIEKKWNDSNLDSAVFLNRTNFPIPIWNIKVFVFMFKQDVMFES